MPSLIARLFPPSESASRAAPPSDATTAGSGPAVDPDPALAPGPPADTGVLDRLFPGHTGRPEASPPTGASPSPGLTNGGEPVTAVQLIGEAEPEVRVTTAPADAAAGVCAHCNAPLAADQEWCLECGGQVAQRESGRWRMGLAIASSLLVLAAIGFGIAYVALSDRSARDAALAGPPTRLATPSPVSGTPPTAAIPPTGSVTGPGGALPSPAPDQTPVTPAPGAAPSSAGTPAVPTPTPSASAPSAPSPTPATSTPTKKAPASRTSPSNLVKPTTSGVNPISFDPGTAHGFPADSSAANSQLAGRAVDGNPNTAWYTSSPGTGLYVDAATPSPVKSVTLTTSTPGFVAAIYGAISGPPGTLSGWTQLAGPSTISTKQTFSVSGSAQYRYFLVYVSQLPSGGSRAAVNELAVLP